jgi:hypothetical protein
MKTALGICLVLVTLTFCAWFLMNRTRTEAVNTARDAAQIFRSLVDMTPEVRITAYVTVQRTSSILELATVKKEITIPYRYEASWAGSTKTLELGSAYTLKAGFDLRERFTLDVDEETHVIHATFPAPKLLSVQQDKYWIQRDADGWWNKITPQDRESAINSMNGLARVKAADLGILDEARETLRKQLTELAGAKGQKWDIRFRD